MNGDLTLIIQLILIVVLSIVALIILRLYSRLQKEKRITRFSIDALSYKSSSFFDVLFNALEEKVENSVKSFEKINIFKKYAKRYDKYVMISSRAKDNSMKFIIHKFLIAFISVFITIISDVLRLKEISFLQLITTFILGFFIYDVILILENIATRKQKEEDLLKAIIIMDNAFKSGKSVMQTVELVSEELDGPLKYEFKKMFIDLNYGLDIETVFNRFADRLDFEEARYMSSGLVILNRTGGNIVKIFDALQKGFFDRKKLKEELKSATALSNFIYKFLCILPVFLVTIIYIYNPLYFEVLYTTVAGKVILIIILLIYLIYILLIRKINRLED